MACQLRMQQKVAASLAQALALLACVSLRAGADARALCDIFWFQLTSQCHSGCHLAPTPNMHAALLEDARGSARYLDVAATV